MRKTLFSGEESADSDEWNQLGKILSWEMNWDLNPGPLPPELVVLVVEWQITHYMLSFICFER